MMQTIETKREALDELCLQYHVGSLEVFGRKVDLLTRRSLRNPYFVDSVEKTRQLLYAA